MNYGELKALILQYAHNGAIEELVPTFIAMAQARMSRDLKVTELEVQADLPVIAGESIVTAPTDMLEILDLQMPFSGGSFGLEQTTQLQIAKINLNAVSGTAAYYARYGDNIALAPLPGEDTTITCTYRKKLDAFNVDDDTDFLLTDSPNIYVYASMIEVVPFIREDQADAGYTNKWKKYYDTEVAALNAQAEDARWSGGPIQITQLGMGNMP